MKKIKDKKIIVLAVILIVFTIGYFIIVNKISYAFDNNYDLTWAYNNTMNTIKKCAIAYGKDNIDSFNDEGLLYIEVQSLIDNGYIATNEAGNIVNSLNNKENLNNKKIRLKYENKEISAEIYS